MKTQYQEGTFGIMYSQSLILKMSLPKQREIGCLWWISYSCQKRLADWKSIIAST